MNTLTCSFTGHREIFFSHWSTLPEKLSDTIDALIASGVGKFCSGGAMGFDLIAAEAVIKKRDSGADIKLCMVLPCRDQAARWGYAQREQYETVLSLADEVIYLSEKYDRFCMQQRNIRLVDECDILLSYHVKESGGTAHTVNYAMQKNKKIVNLADFL